MICVHQKTFSIKMFMTSWVCMSCRVPPLSCFPEELDGPFLHESNCAGLTDFSPSWTKHWLSETASKCDVATKQQFELQKQLQTGHKWLPATLPFYGTWMCHWMSLSKMSIVMLDKGALLNILAHKELIWEQTRYLSDSHWAAMQHICVFEQKIMSKIIWDQMRSFVLWTVQAS